MKAQKSRNKVIVTCILCNISAYIPVNSYRSSPIGTMDEIYGFDGKVAHLNLKP